MRRCSARGGTGIWNECKTLVSSLHVPCEERSIAASTLGSRARSATRRNAVVSCSSGSKAFISWLIVTGHVVTATGKERDNINPRTTISKLPPGIKQTEEPTTASSKKLSCASAIKKVFMSLGLTHGMSPFQKSGRDLLGVPPPLHSPSFPSGTQSQCPGKSSSSSSLIY